MTVLSSRKILRRFTSDSRPPSYCYSCEAEVYHLATGPSDIDVDHDHGFFLERERPTIEARVEVAGFCWTPWQRALLQARIEVGAVTRNGWGRPTSERLAGGQPAGACDADRPRFDAGVML